MKDKWAYEPPNVHSVRVDRVVCYMYNADLYHPACMLDVMRLPQGDPEKVLSDEAIRWGINRGEEESFDSDEFPKVVFAGYLSDENYCGLCGETLL
jgi:hypothetical protein